MIRINNPGSRDLLCAYGINRMDGGNWKYSFSIYSNGSVVQQLKGFGRDDIFFIQIHHFFMFMNLPTI